MRWVLVGVLAIGLPVWAAGQVLFEDDFSDGLSKWGDPAKLAGWEIEDGALVRSDPNGGSTLLIGDDTWRDYVVEFRLMRTQVLEGGHNGIVIRNANERRCHIFLRPDGLRYEMPPVTETGFAVRPLAFETGRWYRFRIIVQGRDAVVEVDDVYQGTVSGVHNSNGGIGFGAYRVALKLAEVKVTAIPPTEKITPPAPPEVPLDPAKLDRSVTIHVVSTSRAVRPDWPVVCRVKDLGLPAEANLSSLTAFDAQGNPLPSQLDDTDLSGGPTPDDEFCFTVTLPPASVTPVETRFGTSQVTYRRAGTPAVAGEPGRIAARDYAITWSTKQANGKAVNEAAQYRFDSPEGPVFFNMLPWDGEETVAVTAGPVRTLWVSRAPLEADGLLTRRIECYPRLLRMTAQLAPAPGLSQAAIRAPFWGGVGTFSFHWQTPMLERVQALRWRDTRGYGENLQGGFQKVFFPEGANGRHFEMDLGDGALFIDRWSANDYDPGAFLVGQHYYYMGHLHFGWRAPIMVWADAPSITRLTVQRIASGREPFVAEEEVGREPLVLSEAAERDWVARQAALARLIREVRADAVSGEPKSLAEAARLRAELEHLDLPETIQTLDSDRRRLIEQLEANRAETTPQRALLRRMQPALAAARWDWNVGRYDRAVERVAWARLLARRAGELAKTAPPTRLVGEVRPGPIVPYVTISGQASRDMAELGLTVSHDWMGWSGSEPSPGEFDWSGTDKLVDAVNESGLNSLPLLDFAPPKWFSEKHKDFGLHELVDPRILGHEPEPLQAFGRWIAAASKRFDRADRIVCWSLRNEPAYLPGGAVKSPLMLEAMRKWLARRYGDIAKLNEIWGTRYASFDEVQSPQARDKEPAAWYDMAVFKAEAIAGELAWEADIVQRNSRVGRTGGKFVPTIIDVGGVRWGVGPDPWTASACQRGVALCDLYTDSDWQTYRLASELWFATQGGSPVISAETGLSSRPRERRHRWVRYPDERQRSFAWSALQFGLYGVQFWTWGGAEEYGSLNWDGTVPDDVIWAAMANQERVTIANLLSSLKPVTRVGYYYPQATFIDAAEADDMPDKYARLFGTLTDLGYQLRDFSFRDIDQALKEIETVVLPPALYVETEVIPKLREFVRNGGRLLVVTEPATYDEHLRPLNGGRSALAEVIGEGGKPVTSASYGKGRAAWIRDPVGLSFGRGRPVVELATKWRFRFGLSWPQQGMNATRAPAGSRDLGEVEHWESPEYDDSQWGQIAVPGVWEDNGYPDLDGYGWYRLAFDLPGGLKGRRILLTGDTLDDCAWIYVNGRLVRQTQSWDESFQEDVTKCLRPGGRNVIALRILDNCFRGGVRGRLTLTSPDLPSEDRALLDEALRSLGVVPEAACSASGVVRRLMADGNGGRHLLYTNETSNSLEADITLPFTLGAARGELMNLLEGQRFGFETRNGETIVHVKLGANDIGLLPLKGIGRP